MGKIRELQPRLGAMRAWGAGPRRAAATARPAVARGSPCRGAGPCCGAGSSAVRRYVDAKGTPEELAEAVLTLVDDYRVACRAPCAFHTSPSRLIFHLFDFVKAR